MFWCLKKLKNASQNNSNAEESRKKLVNLNYLEN